MLFQDKWGVGRYRLKIIICEKREMCDKRILKKTLMIWFTTEKIKMYLVEKSIFWKDKTWHVFSSKDYVTLLHPVWNNKITKYSISNKVFLIKWKNIQWPIYLMVSIYGETI